MCGILSAFTPAGARKDEQQTGSSRRIALEGQIYAGLEKINHRGPDSTNLWISSDCSVGLGHVRLSIIDLSEAGQQPFHDSADTIHVVVNGELYDHDRIRGELQAKGHVFKSTSDSEIVIGLWKEFGLDFLSHLRGEFALVLYDSTTRIFIVARDRYGIKPLFYTTLNGRLLIASEAKAFLGFGWVPEWDVVSLAQSGWVFQEKTLFKGVRKLLPGHYMLYDNSGHVNTAQYWDPSYADCNVPENRTVDEMILSTRSLLLESIRLRLRADVPVAVYLSGGIDSSVVAGMVQHLVKQHATELPKPKSVVNEESYSRMGPFATSLDCFTIRFTDSIAHDESGIAARTAEHLGARIHYVDVGEEELAELFERATWHCEHATPDLGFIGKVKLAEETRKAGFKVVLTGEGSDEHFGGYTIFEADYLRLPDKTFKHPDPRLQFSEQERLALFDAREGPQIEAALAKREGNYAGFSTEKLSFRDAAVPRAMLAGTSTCRRLVSGYELPTDSFAPWVTDQLVPVFDRCGAYARAINGIVREKMKTQWHPLHTGLYTQLKGTFHSILLSCLGDRVEMSASIEARTPFLDHKLTEYVNQCPPSVKFVRGESDNPSGLPSMTEKYLLREAAKPFITPEIYSRKKHPYFAPIMYKPGGALHKLVTRLLTKEKVEHLGWANWEVVNGFIERGFEGGEVAYIRQAFVLAQLVVLAEKFGIPPAQPWI